MSESWKLLFASLNGWLIIWAERGYWSEWADVDRKNGCWLRRKKDWISQISEAEKKVDSYNEYQTIIDWRKEIQINLAQLYKKISACSLNKINGKITEIKGTTAVSVIRQLT